MSLKWKWSGVVNVDQWWSSSSHAEFSLVFLQIDCFCGSEEVDAECYISDVLGVTFVGKKSDKKCGRIWKLSAQHAWIHTWCDVERETVCVLWIGCVCVVRGWDVFWFSCFGRIVANHYFSCRLFVYETFQGGHSPRIHSNEPLIWYVYCVNDWMRLMWVPYVRMDGKNGQECY